MPASRVGTGFLTSSALWVFRFRPFHKHDACRQVSFSSVGECDDHCGDLPFLCSCVADHDAICLHSVIGKGRVGISLHSVSCALQSLFEQYLAFVQGMRRLHSSSAGRAPRVGATHKSHLYGSFHLPFLMTILSCQHFGAMLFTTTFYCNCVTICSVFFFFARWHSVIHSERN